MVAVGGLRVRLIHENMYNLVNDALDDLGWFNINTDEYRPVTFLAESVTNDDTVEPNLITLTCENSTDFEGELGSSLTEKTWDYYVDVYAENDALAMHLAGDLNDVLQGKFTQTVSRQGPDVTVYDLTVQAATPVPAFTISLENVNTDRSRFHVKPWQKFWWVVSFQVVDRYYSQDME